MAYSHLPYPSNPSLEQLKVIATDTVIWVSTTGSDGSGNGSETSPYATLTKAMDVAREYTIVGKAILYIRLKRGEYNLATNLDLYHPQGGNLIIEGDPAEIKQRVIWQVQGYSWNLETWGGGGHTATIRLWDGLTTSSAGHTMHGFSADETGMYFSVMNAYVSSRSGYKTNSAADRGIPGAVVQSGLNSYGAYFHGDRFFNAGVSHEDASGIIGIGRVHSATASNVTMAVQFNNMNYDCRCPGWTWANGSGGLNNSIAWGGIPSNYPEPQYSQPNGYYGPAAGTGWTAETDATAYPANPGVSHNTTDPYVLTTYPVVIRAPYASYQGTLFLKNGKLRALRNIFFAPRSKPFMYSASNSYNAATDGLGITYSSTMSIGRLFTTTLNGPAVYLENADVGIRNLGFTDVDFPLALHSSTLRNYYDTTIDTTNTSAVVSNFPATSSVIDNSPILCITNANVGVLARDSSINLVDPSAVGWENDINYRMDGIYISARWRGLQLTNSTFSAVSANINMISDIPRMEFSVVHPWFDGNLSLGASGTFVAASGSPWDVYPLAKVYMNTPGVGEREIAVLGTNSNGAATSSQLSGLTVGAVRVGPQDPAGYYASYFRAIRTAPEGLCFWTLSDWHNAITAGVGGTMSIRFFPTMTASGASAELIVGRTSVLVKTHNGTTCGWINMGTANTVGSSAAVCIRDLSSYGGHWTYCQGSYTTNAILATENSAVDVLKSIWVYNGGHDAIDIRKNSRLTVGEVGYGGYVIGNAGTPYQNIIANPEDARYANGTVAITGYAQSAMRITENSSATVGFVFTKHPMHSPGISATNYSNDSGIGTTYKQNAVKVEDNSSAKFINLTCVGRMGASTIRVDALWTTFTGVKNGLRVSASNIRDRDAFVSVDRGSRFILKGIRDSNWYMPGSVFSLDGGTGAVTDFKFNAGSNTPEILIFKVGSGSHCIVDGVNALSDSSGQSLTSTRVLTDARVTNDRRIMTRNSGVVAQGNNTQYGVVPNTIRSWNGAETTFGYTAHGLNIGAEGAGAASWIVVQSGITLHAYTDSNRNGSISTS